MAPQPFAAAIQLAIADFQKNPNGEFERRNPQSLQTFHIQCFALPSRTCAIA
jgi:hypothetical protein